MSVVHTRELTKGHPIFRSMHLAETAQPSEYSLAGCLAAITLSTRSQKMGSWQVWLKSSSQTVNVIYYIVLCIVMNSMTGRTAAAYPFLPYY